MDNKHIDKHNARKGTANIFILYAKVFRVFLSKLSKVRAAREEELDKLILPSNDQWRQKVYYDLVELQRGADVEIKKKKKMDDDDDLDDFFEREWDPKGRLSLLLSRKQRTHSDDNFQSTSVLNCGEPDWNFNDILLAAKVLEKNCVVNYNNEWEMRRVLNLVYDVLRYKSILSEALDDIDFWFHHFEMKTREIIVLLLFYDMQTRKPPPLNRMSLIDERRRALNNAGLLEIDQALSKNKTALSASLARMRIDGQAHQLDFLLPRHLRTLNNKTTTSLWVNTLKIPKCYDFISKMTKLGFQVCYECPISSLNENIYNFDPLCPKVVNFHTKATEKLAVSDLVRNYYLVFLDRSLCIGAAALYQAIRAEGLGGPVVLTHAVAPRHAGYLITLLADVKNFSKLLIFGTGLKKTNYEKYLANLGIDYQRYTIYSKSYTDSPSTSETERATVVLATPCSSYSGINNIVDLVIAKEGDINIIESLCNLKNVEDFKECETNQLDTLKCALQKPNVQLLIYEVHSILANETFRVVEEAISYTNNIIREKHNKMTAKKSKKDKTLDTTEKQVIESSNEESGTSEVQVPDCDLFEVTGICDIYDDNSINEYINKGCFINIIKRKDIQQFNSIFMIKYAESKGLFGSSEKCAEIPKVYALKDTHQYSGKTARKSVNLKRISSHTQSTLSKKKRQSEVCPKVKERASRDKDLILSKVLETKKLDAKRWWIDSVNYLTSSSESYQFRIMRTDPLSRRFLYPLRVLQPLIETQNQKISALSTSSKKILDEEETKFNDQKRPSKEVGKVVTQIKEDVEKSTKKHHPKYSKISSHRPSKN